MADEFDADAAVRAYMGGSAPNPETALKASLQDTIGQNPDQAADWRRVAATIGVPVDTAQALPEWSKQQAALQAVDTSALARMNPVTTAFLTDPGNAAIAHDDIQDMGLLETLANSFRRGVPGLQQNVAGTMLRANAAQLEQFDAIAAQIDAGASPTSIRAADDPMGVAFMSPAQRERFRASISTPLAGNIATVASTQKERQAIAQPGVVGEVLDAKTFGAAFSAFMTAPVQFIASIGPESLISSAPGLVAAIPAGIAGGPAAAATVMGAGSFATDYGSSIVEALTKAGVDVTNPDALAAATQNGPLMRDVAAQAFAHASVVGTVDGISGGVASKLVLPKALATRLATKPLARELTNVGVQVPAQGVLGGIGEAGGEIAAGQELQPGNILAEIVGEAFSAPAEIGGVAGRRVLERIQEGRTAEAAAVRIEEAVKLAEASKLRARDPAAFREFVDQVADGGDTPTEFFIDPQQMANTLNQSGITMVELDALAPSLAAQMRPENFMPGADLRLSVADLLSAPADISAALIDHLRETEGAMTRAEATQYLDTKGDAIRAEVETELGRQDARTAYQAGVDQVRDQFQAQLNAAGRFTPAVNTAYASLLGNFYASQAQRAGMAPQELMERYRLGVSNESVTGRRRLDQRELGTVGSDDLGAQVSVPGAPLPDRGDVQPVLRDPEGNGAAAGAKHLSDLLEADTLRAQENALGEAPPLLSMLARMRRAVLDDPKVLDAIVGAVPVDVVNNLFGSETAAKVALHDEAMLQDSSAFDADEPVSGGLRDASLSVGLLVRQAAIEAAKVARVALGAGLESAEGRAAALAGQRNSLSQDGDSKASAARANLVFSDDITLAQSTIVLLAGADLTSFLHESGHFFLEVQADLAARIAGKGLDGDSVTDGERGIVADMETVLQAFGVTGTPDQSALTTWLSMSLEEKREHHETFARSFERYAMEGKAPNPQLQEVFQRFRAWLVQVYRTLAGLNVNLSDDVRAVFDRMLATDQAIQEAQDARNMGPLFATPEQAGMTPEEYAAYQALGQRATDEAAQDVDTRLLKDLKWLRTARDKAIRARQKEVAAIRQAVRNEVSREVWAQPVYQAWQFLTGKGEAIAAGTVAAEDIDTVQQSARLRTSVVKDMDAFSAETLIRRKMTNDATGMHPDIVADLNPAWGFDSGQDLIAALAAADAPGGVIESLTDQRMLEQHGDIASRAELERAADEAVHNQMRARVIATELKALDKATTRRDSSDSLYGGGTVDVMAQAAKNFAREVIGRVKLKDLRPKVYAAAEARSAKLAQQSLGDVAEAAMHKRNQLVNNFATRAAYDAQAEITAADTFFKKVLAGSQEKVSKTRDMGIVQAARAILAEYGIGTKGEPASRYLEAIAQNDPGMHAVLRDKIDALTAQAKPVDEMTVDEFRALTDEIQGLWHQARRARQIEIDGKMVDIEMAQGDLAARLFEIGVPDRVPGEGQAVTDGERRLSRLQTLRAALRRVEAWVGVKDGANEMGPFRKYIWQPVKEAADAYRADKATYIKRYKQLLDTVDLKQSKVAAPELGYTFGHSRGGSGKAEILHAILHTGNASNKRKLLLGRGWAVENEVTGELDTRKWDGFVRRMIDTKVLTKADFDFAQGVWDLLEDTKALAQKTHRDVFGRYFDEVTADEFANEFGTYRGGYVPAMMDHEVVKDQATRSLQEDENQTLAYAFPSTSKGFTKARVEHNRPLLLDLRTLSSHLDKVLLFSHMESPIRDVRKVLGSKDVSEPLHRIDPQAFDGLLTPWLNRAARQTVETKVPGDSGTMRFFSKMRQRAGLAAMFANVSNTAQQITGLSIAAVKVRPKYLLEAVAQSLIAPRQTARAVAEASVYMGTRMDSEVAAMTDAIDQILMNPNLYEKAQSWTAQHAYFMQSAVDNFLGPIVWNGAYNQALEQGMNQKDAVRLADSTVRQTQGSTMPEDVSRIETGNAFVRMFTQFAGYFNMQANLLGTEFARSYHDLGLRKGMGRGLYIFVLGFLVPNMVAELIAQAFKGGPDDEDKDGSTLDDWLMSVVVMGNIKSSLAMIPGVGQASNALINTFNSKPYDDRITTSPAISMIESAVSAPHSVYKAVTGEGSTRKAVRDLATLISMTTGLPATAIARPLGYLAGVSEDRIAPTSTADAVRGMVTGTPSPESKQ